MARNTATITAADQWTDWLSLRGEGRHLFGIEIYGSFVATVTVQIRRADESTQVIDIDTFTAPAARTGEFVGSFDVRLGVKAGDFTSGPIEVEVNS